MSPLAALARGLLACRRQDHQIMKAAFATLTAAPCSSGSINGWVRQSVGAGVVHLPRAADCSSSAAAVMIGCAASWTNVNNNNNPWAQQRLPAGARAMSFTMTSPTKLSEVMHVEHLADKTADEIEAIWLEFHDPSSAPASSSSEDGGSCGSGSGSGAAGEAQAAKPAPSQQRRVADVMAADEWRQLQARARSSPMFVLPLAKPGGFLTLLINWQGPVALLTSVEEYRRFGPGAPPHMAITHYTELADSKGIVLLRGDVVNDAVVSLAEARTLLQLVRAFYTDPAAHRLVYKFNHESDKFDFNELLAQLGHKEVVPPQQAGGGAESSGTSSSSST